MMNCFLKFLREKHAGLRGAIILVGCAVALPVAAQQPMKTLLVGVDHRTVTSLNGDWHYLVDQPPARGLYTVLPRVGVLVGWIDCTDGCLQASVDRWQANRP